MNRILVIRGGAIGDFILTLPALKALRDTHPDAQIEILGYKHVLGVAEKRFYADAIRSIEYGPLSGFFANNSNLPAELVDYFASFDLVISYLYDPDEIFEHNLRRSGVRNLIVRPAKIHAPGDKSARAVNSAHAARQLARPIEALGIKVADFAAKIFPSPADRQFARTFLADLRQPIIAIHPGSGSEKKNWPLENWITLVNSLLEGETFRGSIIIISGEADTHAVERLEKEWRARRVTFAKSLPLVQLAALLQNAIFVGHDSGISHLAAAAGAKCILLFGATDPAVWAPLNSNVRVIRAPNNELPRLNVDVVRGALQS